jgi:ribonuclease HI
LQDRVIIHTDGASRGNPGPAAAAFILTDETQNVIEGKGFFLGNTTNNVAEYTGLQLRIWEHTASGYLATAN